MTTTKLKAIILEDSVTKEVTIYLDEIGGPIISGATIEEAKSKFTEALNLGLAVRNLKYFAEAVKASDAEKKEYVKRIETLAPQVEYFTVKACA